MANNTEQKVGSKRRFVRARVVANNSPAADTYDNFSPALPKPTSVSTEAYDYAALQKILVKDPNARSFSSTLNRYKKTDIANYISDPYRYEKQLRDASRYVYEASSHYKRLIQYFVGLTDLSYIVSPYKVDPNKSENKLGLNYRKTLGALSSMGIKTQIPKILTVCLREDTFYGTLWAGDDTITIQQLPSDYCKITSIENNVLNISFDFSFFDTRGEALEMYPLEFTTKYREYKRNKNLKWIELDSPTSFAIKYNMDTLDCSIPPFAGILREVYDIEDYKQLKLSKTALENYAMLAMRIPLNPDGTKPIDFTKAETFWRNLDSILPDEIGSVLTPMDIEKISFERAKASDRDTIADAEQNLFTAAGVSSLLFNNEKASANALQLSIKTDQAITFSIVKNIEDVINRFIQAQPYGKNFKVIFLDVSPFNRKESGEAYLKAASYGLPTISMYAASQGLSQEELDSMSYLETKILKLPEMFVPIRSSTQMSSAELDGKGATDEGGAPVKEVGDISDSTETNREGS